MYIYILFVLGFLLTCGDCVGDGDFSLTCWKFPTWMHANLYTVRPDALRRGKSTKL